MNRFLKKTIIVALSLCMAASASFAQRQLAIPNFVGRPGNIVSIPITLDSASSVAAARIKVNYNPQIVDFVVAKNDGLGAAFELSQSAKDGVITLMLTRSTSLLTGSGRLVVLQFRVNSGAQSGLSSDLALAEYDLSDDSGVKSINLTEPVTASNGRITVTLGTVDNNSDNIPDDWEASFGLSTIDPNTGDSDGDGINDLLEYALGMNPTIATRKGLPTIGTATINGIEKLTLEFNRRRNAAIDYLVEESSDLSRWQVIDQTTHMVDTPIDLGNGFEEVKVHGDIQMSGPNSQTKGFLRLRVSPQ